MVWPLEESEQPLWGELHTHTALSDGLRSPEEAVADARAHLDFWAPADHLCMSFDRSANKKLVDGWEQLQATLADADTPGEFVTFLAYEYTSLEGDWNLYFPTLAGELYNPPDIHHLCEYARAVDGMLVPHHTGYKVNGRGIDWARSFASDVMPLVEVYSMHGSSEADDGYWPMDLPWMGPRASAGCARSGLDAGLRFGFIASSDGHGGYPGCYKMGLAAVWASSCHREAIWEALYSRHCYAVSGDRIWLQFFVNNQPMGSEIEMTSLRFLEVLVACHDRIEWIDIVRNGRVWHRHAPLPAPCGSADGGRWLLRVEWGWGNAAQEWKVDINLSEGRIVKAWPNFGPPGPNRITSVSERSLSVLSHTDGRTAFDWRFCRNGREPTQQIVILAEAPGEATLCVEAEGLSAEISLTALASGSRVWYLRDEFSPRLKLHCALPYNVVAEHLELEDHSEEPAYYYVRVRQANGQMAWSSPVWVGP